MTTVRSILTTLLAMLREIFDEAAYERFLRAKGAAASSDSYCHFLQDRHAPGTPRRCC